MKKDPNNAKAEGLRVKESLVEALISQTDQEVLADAEHDAIRPDEALSRVLDAFHRAQQGIEAPVGASIQQGDVPKKKPTVLSIDGARARAILKRVAASPSTRSIPLPNAAQLDQIKSDAEALDMVASLKSLGVISEDETK